MQGYESDSRDLASEVRRSTRIGQDAMFWGPWIEEKNIHYAKIIEWDGQKMVRNFEEFVFHTQHLIQSVDTLALVDHKPLVLNPRNHKLSYGVMDLKD